MFISIDRSRLKETRHYSSSRARLAGLAALVGSLVSIQGAFADQIEEIVVTAQKREESIQTVPIAITALSGEQMRSFGMNTAKDVASQAPGVLITSTASGSVSVLPTIRGVTQNDYTTHQEPPVAVYVDDAYISSPGAISFSLYDLDRTQILRGPQGTLFGRNATGGAIQFITAKPTKDFEGFTTITYGSYAMKRIEAAVSGSITDRIQARFSLLSEKSSPWWENRAPADISGGNGDAFGVNTLSGRAQLRFLVSDSVEDLVSFSRSLDKRHEEGTYKEVPAAVNAQGVGYTISPTSLANGTCPGCDYFGYRDPNISTPFQSSWNAVGFIQRQYNNVSNTLTWKASAFTLTSVTNYQTFRYDYNEDCDATPYDVCRFDLGQQMHQLSQEVRANGTAANVDWTVGAYFLDITQHNYQGYGTGITNPADPLYAFAFADLEVFPQTSQGEALFAQTDYHFAPDFTLTTGARLTHDKKQYESITSSVPGGVAFYEYTRANGDDTVEQNTDWTGKIELAWQAAPGALLFAGVTRGAKGPGFNSMPVGELPSGYNPKFGSEHLLDYEVGSKITFFDGKARINTALFYYDYKGYQAFNYILDSAVVANRDAQFYGGEIEALVQPASGWQIGFGLSAEQGTVYGVLLPSGETADRLPPQMPHVTMNGIIRKAWETPVGELSAQFDGRFTGDHYATITNAPDTQLPGATILNARVGLKNIDGHWDTSLWVKNLANKAMYNYAFDNAAFYGMAAYSYAPPRWIGVDVTFHW